MSTTSGTMRNLKVTDKDGNIFNMAPVDSEARQAIDEAKNIQFDEDYFTSELSQDETELSIGLNGVPIGVESPLKFIQDDDQGIVIGSDALTQASADTLYQPIGDYATTSTVDSISTDVGTLKTASSTWDNVTNKLDSSAAFTKSSADTLYYPLSNNPSGYLTEITGDFSGNNVSATTVNLKYIKNAGGYYYTSAVELNAGNLCFQKSNPGTSEGTTDINADNIQLAGGGGTDAAMTMKHNEIYINSQGSQQCVKITPSYIEAVSANHVVSASWYDLISYITAHM